MQYSINWCCIWIWLDHASIFIKTYSENSFSRNRDRARVVCLATSKFDIHMCRVNWIYAKKCKYSIDILIEQQTFHKPLDFLLLFNSIYVICAVRIGFTRSSSSCMAFFFASTYSHSSDMWICAVQMKTQILFLFVLAYIRISYILVDERFTFAKQIQFGAIECLCIQCWWW